MYDEGRGVPQDDAEAVRWYRRAAAQGNATARFNLEGMYDRPGNVVGVVTAKLDALKIARATGDIPQNVNFAVSAGAARAFLDSEGVAYATAPSGEARAPDEVAAAATAFTVLVECWK